MCEIYLGKCNSEPLKCNFPCPCTKCKAQRKADEMQSNKEENEKVENGENGKNGDCDEEELLFGGNNLTVYITEAISFLAFLFIAIAMIWINIIHIVVHLGIKLYNSDRNTHNAVLVVVCLLVLSTSLNLLFTKKRKEPPPKSWIPKFLSSKKGVKVNEAPKNQTKIKVKTSGATIQTKTKTIKISDSEAKEIFRKSKLFAIPMEMKRPPALLVYLQTLISSSS